MRIAFLGTPTAAVPVLESLVAAGHEVAVVVTQPDRRRGRGLETSPSPLKAAASELGLVVSHDLADVRKSGVPLAVVVAYGAIVPAEVLEHVVMLNVHFSLLPRWRGAAPVERAILAGDERTGVCIMGLEATLDTGPIYAQASTEVDAKSASELTAELSQLGAQLLVELLPNEHLPAPHPQDGVVTYARKLTSADHRLDPDLTADQLARVVRIGPAVARVSGRRLRVHRATVRPGVVARRGEVLINDDGVLLGAADGVLRLDEVQPDGGRAMTAAAWLAGARLDSGDRQWSRITDTEP